MDWGTLAIPRDAPPLVMLRSVARTGIRRDGFALAAGIRGRWRDRDLLQCRAGIHAGLFARLHGMADGLKGWHDFNPNEPLASR